MLSVRVYFEDTDFSGFVYHASYFRWCERGRSDFLRLLGISHSSLASGALGDARCAFAVRRLSAEFLKPARIDDIVDVHTRAGEAGKASIALDQTVRRGAEVIFRLTVQCVLVSSMGRLMRLPARLRDRMSAGAA